MYVYVNMLYASITHKIYNSKFQIEEKQNSALEVLNNMVQVTGGKDTANSR